MWGFIPTCVQSNALVIGFPEGSYPGLMWENTGTLWGLCNKISARVVGEM